MHSAKKHQHVRLSQLVRQQIDADAFQYNRRAERYSVAAGFTTAMMRSPLRRHEKFITQTKDVKDSTLTFDLILPTTKKNPIS